MQTESIKQTLVNFLNENITAASICLRSNPIAGEGYEHGDVLGFPTAILLLSVIDAIGTIKLGSSKSFEILSTPLFNSQNISAIVASDLYQSYRNPFLHNNILVLGRTLSKGNGLEESFEIQNDKVINIDLASLLKICKTAVEKFESSITEEEVLASEKIQDHIIHRSISNNPGPALQRGSVLARIPENDN